MMQQTLKTAASDVADLIQEHKNVDSDKALAHLMELIFNLNHNKYEASFEPWNGYKNLIQQTGFIFSDPEVSGRLDGFCQKNAYQMFKELSYFFEILEDDQDLQNFILIYALRHWSGGATLEILNDLMADLNTDAPDSTE